MNKKNPFGDIGAMISNGGLGELLEASNRFNIKTADIVISKQVRDTFEDAELNELSESILKHGVLQNIIANERINAESGVTEYVLIAGERRVRAARMANLEEIPALILNVDDETARQIQLLENIQRENLTAIELANALDTELAELDGDYEQLATKYNKSRGWLSKALQMNKVTGAAQEVMAVTSDAEVILAIQTIEKTNPEKAGALVEKVKEDFGKKNVRKTVKKELKQERDDQKAKKSGTAKPAIKPEASTTPDYPLAAPKKEPKEYDLGGAVEPDNSTGIAVLDAEDMSVEQLQKVWDANIKTLSENSNSLDELSDEVQSGIDFGDALDVFVFAGKEVPDKNYDAVLKQEDIFKELYEKAANEKQFNNYFLKTLKAAGFKLDSKNLNLSALIELSIIVNSSEPHNLEKMTLNVRDTLEAFKNEND